MESISRRRRRAPGWFVTVVALVIGVFTGVGGGVVGARSAVVPGGWADGFGLSPRQPWTGGLAPPTEGFRPGTAWAALTAASRPPSPDAAEPRTSEPVPALGLTPTPAPVLPPEPTLDWATALMAAPWPPPVATSRPARARAAPQARLSWPLSPVPVVLKYFDAPETPFGAGHRGVDLAAAPGQEVLAADAGVVVFAGVVAGRPVISVDHDGGLRTTYEPVASQVGVGVQVYRGQVLGTVLAGHPGCLVAACLHWGVRRGEEYVDPLALTGEVGEYRLKPWGGGP